jgi:hypothetical protein
VCTEFTDDVSELPVGPIFTLVKCSFDMCDVGTHWEFRNVVSKLDFHIVYKHPETRKQCLTNGESLKSKLCFDAGMSDSSTSCFNIAAL